MIVDGTKRHLILPGLPPPDTIDRRMIAGTLGPCGSCGNPIRIVAREPGKPETTFYCESCVVRREHIYLYGQLNTSTWEWVAYPKPKRLNVPRPAEAVAQEPWNPRRPTWEEYWNDIHATQLRKGLLSYRKKKPGGGRKRSTATPELSGFFPESAGE